MSTKLKIALTGSSGFVGTALQKHFTDTIVLHRHDNHETLLEKLQGIDVVINLAGAPVIKRWNKTYKKTLFSSRIDTTIKLVKAINESNVSYFVSTSAIGIYPNNQACDESCKEVCDDFLSEVCQAWESEALKCTKPTSILRFGVILGDGGALKQMLLPFRLGLGGPISDGKMMTSWIHIHDLMRIYNFIITQRLEGVYNATSPEPISNADFTKALGKALHRPTLFPLPAFILKLIYGEAASILTDSKEVYPKVLMEAGFEFENNTINKALNALLN